MVHLHTNITQFISTLGCTSAAPAALLLNTDRAGLARSGQQSGVAEVWETICLRLLFVFPRLASVLPRPTGCRCMWAEL